MTGVYTVRQLTTRAKDDALDFYIIARAMFLPAVPGAPEYALADHTSRHSLTATARSFILRDAGVEPTR